MDIEIGDDVLVNLAPFIGSSRRSRNSIPCRVVAVEANHVEVRTLYPFREFSLRVLSVWIEGKAESAQRPARPGVRPSSAAHVRQAMAEAVG
jgi:hypothetical protein